MLTQISSRLKLFFTSLLLVVISSCNSGTEQTAEKPTLCILGGTPSTVAILNVIPDSIKDRYNVISFNRPGFGGTENRKMTKELLYELARKAGLHENDFGIIGISGGGPLAISLASMFKLKHCGIISGMVSGDAYFPFADSTMTKSVMENAKGSYEKFNEAALQFPNLPEIILQAGDSTQEQAIRACYNEINYILSGDLYSTTDSTIRIDWWHGENDKNVAIQSVELFLKNYKNAVLNKIPGADHNIDARVYIEKLLNSWK